jgi:D-alanyl-D-alanine carboxypeptidase
MPLLHVLRSALVACALLCLSVPPAALARPASDPQGARPALDAALAQALDQAVADGAPGAILSVTIPGRGTWAVARGLADRGGEVMTPRHRFRIASITKTFIAVVVLQLVQEGWLSLDHTVHHWLPGLLPAGRSITVRQLLRHTSGLEDYMDSAFMRQVLREPERAWRPRDLVAYAVAQGQVFPPGARGRWHYANTNYVVLGMIVERVTGTTLDHELRYRVIDRLDLRDTFMESGSAPLPGLAHGYQRRKDLTGLDMSFAWAAGNMVSTAADLTRFAQALFAGELLGQAMLAEMTAYGATGGGGWSQTLRYGLGLMEETLRAGDTTFGVSGHTGMLGGYRTALWHLPDRGVTVVAALNLHSANPTLLATAGLAAALAADTGTP